MKTEFNTSQFEFSHGCKPRGYGCWAFATKRDCSSPVFAPSSMSYTQAKQWAARTLNRYAVLYVCP